VVEVADPEPGRRLAALATLGLSEDATAGDVTQAYRRLARVTHPDVTGRRDGDAGHPFAAITEAYHVLTSDPASGAPTSSSPPRRRVPVNVRRHDRPPIVAGPVWITPLPPPRE
jgi:hypothetical protein